jgi:hypothetical protein
VTGNPLVTAQTPHHHARLPAPTKEIGFRLLCYERMFDRLMVVGGVSELEQRLLACAADVHAAMARLVETLGEFAGSHQWEGHGIQSIGHWGDINLGLSSRLVNELAVVASRLPELPELAAAFTEGALSVDKVRAVAAVATPASDARFTHMARAGSVAQLQRICRAYARVTENEDTSAERREQCRGVTKRAVDDGLVRITATLDPDEAAIVFAAIDARVEDAWRRSKPAGDETTAEVCAPDIASRRADALVELAAEGAQVGPDPIVAGEHVGVHIHVDAAVLTGERVDGVCEIDGIGPVTRRLVERLLCDCHVTITADFPHASIDLGRSQRTVNRRQRRALQRRDRGCRFPGCAMFRFLHAHHAVPWEHDGPTDMDNLLLLCPTHHRLFHEGAYTLDVLGDGQFTFRRPDGRVIAPPPLKARPDAPPAPGDPRAEGGGERFDLGLTLDALLS